MEENQTLMARTAVPIRGVLGGLGRDSTTAFLEILDESTELVFQNQLASGSPQMTSAPPIHCFSAFTFVVFSAL